MLKTRCFLSPLVSLQIWKRKFVISIFVSLTYVTVYSTQGRYLEMNEYYRLPIRTLNIYIFLWCLTLVGYIIINANKKNVLFVKSWIPLHYVYHTSVIHFKAIKRKIIEKIFANDLVYRIILIYVQVTEISPLNCTLYNE